MMRFLSDPFARADFRGVERGSSERGVKYEGVK